MKKGYIIKDTIKDTKGNTTNIFYTGVDGYVHDFPEYAEPYQKEGNARRKLKRDLTAYDCQQISEKSTIEGGRWVHNLEIVEVYKLPTSQQADNLKY